MPETVRQYLAANAQRELDALRAELDVRLSALEAALARPDPHKSLENLVLDLARVVAAEAESATTRASLQAQLHAQDDAAAATSQVQRLLDAERANIQALRLELEQARAVVDAERGITQAVELAQARTAFQSERDAAARLRRELDDLRKSVEEERLAGSVPHGQAQELEVALRTERARAAEFESELELQRDSATHLSEALNALQRQLAAAKQRAVETRAADAAAHRTAVETLERRYVALEVEHSAANARASELVKERDALTAAQEGERRQAFAAQEAAAAAHRVAVETLERQYAELEGEYGAANALASEVASERDARAAELEAERQQAAAAREAAAAAHRLTVETLERRYAELDRQHSAANARSSELVKERDALAAALEGERQHAVVTQEAAAAAHRSAVEALEHRYAELEGDYNAANALASEVASERAALAAELEGERQQTAAAQEAAAAAHRKAVEALERRYAELDRQHSAANARASELIMERDALAAALEEEQQQAVVVQESADDAHRAAVEALERRCAELEGEFSAANALTSEVVSERAALAAALEAERRQAVAAQEAGAAHHAAIDALERRYAELDRQHSEARARTSEVVNERDALAAALEIAREETVAAQAAVDTRAAAIDADRANAERSWMDAETRVEEAIAERDELAARLDAAERMNQGMREAVEGRLTAIDEVYKKTVKAREEAEARAEAATRDRDRLATELAAGRHATTTTPDVEMAQLFEAATERIRVLELQLFQRDRGPRDRDVDIAPLLDTTASPPSEQAGKSAKRYAFPAATNVKIDREGGLLVDLSVTGAQVICKTSPEVGRIVTLALLSDEAPCFCQGRLLWARREQTAKGRPFRYRVGLVFTAANEAEIEAFIKAHSIG